MRILAPNDKFIELIIKDPGYMIATNGIVCVYRNKSWGLAKIHINSEGYQTIKYKKHSLLIHRIVFRLRTGKIDSTKVINHIDGNKLNNSLSNLELVTQSENNLHAFRVLKRPPVKSNRRLTDEQVIEIRNLHSQGRRAFQLTKQFSVSKCAISHIVNRKTYKDL